MLESVPTDPAAAEGTAQRMQPAQAAPPTVAPELDPSWRAGRKLTEARQQLGLSIAEIADRIRVRREFLEALEEMNIKVLPGKAYALAFLRSYARVLGLDEKAIVEQFQDESALTREDATRPIRDPKSRPHPERPWMVAAAVLVLAGGFVGWRALQHEEARPAAPVEQPATVAPQPAQTASASADAPQRVVEIRALTASWLEARGPDGTVFLSRILNVGDVYRPDPSPGWTLHARDGGAFEVFINGQSAGLLGIAGSPVLGRKIDDIQPTVQAQNAAPRS
ncbi:MAG: helix-turn-helix domain-containing protein [Proteobacteria bacterium]|nr:helix-turn-helix domain-containing protein [Pseudomonadota bacterium]